LGFNIFLAALTIVSNRGFLGARLTAVLALPGAGTETGAAGTGDGTALPVPVELGSRSGAVFFNGVDAVLDFITEIPLCFHPTLLPDQRLLQLALTKQ
jgi:hypothetical protein